MWFRAIGQAMPGRALGILRSRAAPQAHVVPMHCCHAGCHKFMKATSVHLRITCLVCTKATTQNNAEDAHNVVYSAAASRVHVEVGVAVPITAARLSKGCTVNCAYRQTHHDGSPSSSLKTFRCMGTTKNEQPALAGNTHSSLRKTEHHIVKQAVRIAGLPSGAPQHGPPRASVLRRT